MSTRLSKIAIRHFGLAEFEGVSDVAKTANNSKAPIDPKKVLTKILSNGECGCRGEDGNQSRLNASANLERPVQTGLSVFKAILPQ